MNKSKLLIVEDDSVVSKSIQNILEKSGYESHTSLTGEDAILKTKEFQPDIVLMDIKLGGQLDGINAAQIIRDRFNIPVIFLTAYADTSTIKRAKVIEPNGFLVKPIDERDLVSNIELTLYKRQLRVESEKKYRDLYDNAPDMFVSVEVKSGNIINCNQTLATKLGYTKEEIIGRHIFSVYHKDSLEGAKKAFHTFETTGEVHDAELQLKKKDGSKIDVSLNVSSVHDSQGNILHSRSIWRDITKRKLAENELKESEEKYRNLFEYANDATFIMDVTEEHGARFLDCNDRSLKLFGVLNRDQILGKSPVDFSPATQPDGMSSQEKAAQLSQAVMEGQPQFFEWKHQRLDKTLFWVNVGLSRIKIKDQFYMQAVVRDISDRKRADEELRNLIKSFWNVFNYLNFFVLILDINMQVRLANFRLATFLGFKDENKMTGCNWLVYIPEEEREHRVDVHIRADEGFKEQINDILTPDGERVPVRWFNSRMNEDSGLTFSIGIPLTKDFSQEENVDSLRAYWRDIIEKDKTLIKAMKQKLDQLTKNNGKE